MNNTRFATAIHILTILALEPEAWLSSDYIAMSININPVIVRKMIIDLQKAGLVESKKGKEGGCRLAKKAEEIRLSDILLVVKNSDILGKKNNNPNPKCNVGKMINENLDQLYNEIDNQIIKSLEQKTLESFALRF
ncbi:MAG: Rrf2 family transcriptional regulator [Cruoricaptor ignavus]|nr:Rrf2 family transcriptional regulator [Cruoricaptor ignavus]